MLETMASHPGWVFSPRQLATAANPQGDASPSAVNVHISHLRAKLKKAGAPEMVVTVRAAGWRLRRPRTETTSAQGDSFFVGREQELQALHRVLDPSEGHFGLVVGAAGVGKTSLVERLLASVSPQFEVVRAVCDGNGSGDHWLWRQALGEIERRTGRHMAEEPDGHLVTRLLGATPMPRTRILSGADRTLAYDAVHRYLSAALPLHSRPMVVFVDDLQWADDASLTMLSYLLKRLPTLPCSLLAACRSSEAETRSALCPVVSFASQRRLGTRIQLKGLNTGEVATLAQAIIGERGDPDFPVRLAMRTGGNPLYIRECLEAIRGAEGADIDRLITPSLSTLVRGELAWLPEDTQRLLCFCAVAAAQFRPDVVAHAAGLTGNATAFDAALDSGTLVPAGPGTLRFRHALVRDALLEGIPKTDAEAMHLAVGMAVKRAPETTGCAAAQLAHHLARAGLASRPAAIGYLAAVARASANRFAFEDALGYLREALDLLNTAVMIPERKQRVRSALLERSGSVHAALAESSSAIEMYEQALSARPHEDAPAVARLLTRIGHAQACLRRRGQCIGAYTEALEALESVPVRDRSWWQAWIEVRLGEADAAMLMAMDLPHEGFFEELGARVLEYGTAEQRVKHYTRLSDRLRLADRWRTSEASIEAARCAVEASNTGCSDLIRSYALTGLGCQLVNSNMLTEGEDCLRQALDLSHRCADSIGIQCARFMLAVAARLQGDVRTAEAHALELELLTAERATLPEFVTGAQAHLAWVALRRDRVDEAADRSERALAEWLREPACNQGVWMMAWPAVACALDRGDVQHALESASLMTRADQEVQRGDLHTRLEAVVALQQRGETAAAGDLLGSLATEAREYGYT